MGGVLSNQSTILDEVTERSNSLVEECVKKIPNKYQAQKDHIVHEMQKVSPNAFHGLYIKDYPQKNEKQVNKLAIHNITSKEIKEEISREVNAQIDPIIEENTVDLNPLGRWATEKAIHRMIKKVVGVAVTRTQAQLERQFGVDSSKDDKQKK